MAQRSLPDPEADVLGLDGIAAAVALWYADKRAADTNWRELEGGQKLNEVSGAPRLVLQPNAQAGRGVPACCWRELVSELRVKDRQVRS